MKKILFLSNTANFSKFNRPYMRLFKEQGWQVDYCSCGEEEVSGCDAHYTISIERSPFSVKNIKAFFELKKLLGKNDYDILHCHTPMGGVLGRLAAKKLYKQKKIKVIYTAHGFHFYKGAPIFNWLFYYPMERVLSHFTDALITINGEDFNYAKKFCCPSYLIPGVGVDLKRFCPPSKVEKSVLRKYYGFEPEDFVLIYTAEFIKRKNHKLLFSLLPELKEHIPNLKVILCGKGKLFDAFQKISAKNGMENYVMFTGYNNKIEEFYKLSDVCISTSLQEGLSLNLIEGMGCALPVVASDIRGHKDSILPFENGILFSLKNPASFPDAIFLLNKNPALCKEMGERNIKRAALFSERQAVECMKKIYSLFD